MRSLLTSLIAVALTFPSTAQSAVVNRKLSGPMVTGTVGDVGQFVISPGGDRVLHEVFLREDVFSLEEIARLEVCSSDGSGASTVLTPYFPNIYWFRWTPDETRAVFVTLTGYEYELYSVLVDGSAPPVLLSGDVVLSSAHENVQLTEDGSRVVYLHRNRVSFPDDPIDDLYSVPVDGSAAPRRLSGQPVRDRYVTHFLVSGSTVVYRYYTSTYRLYAVPADGSSAPITLTGSFELDCCSEFFIDSSGTRAVILGSWVSSVPLDGSTAPVHLSSGNAVSFRVSPVGEEVVYRKSQGSSLPSQLFLVPVDGSAAPMHVADGPPAYGGEFNEFSPDGAHVVFYVQSAGSWGPVGLYSARVSDGAVATLHSTSVRMNIQFSPDSARVVFTSSDSRELYSVPVDGASPAVRINPDLVPGGAVAEYAVTPDSSSVLYRADAETDGLVELFQVEIAPSGAPVATRLNPPMVPGGTLDAFRMAPDASYVLYRIDAEADGVVELVRSPGHDVLDGPLPTAVTGDAVHVDARNGRVVYVADQEVESRFELYGVPADGSAAPVKLSGTLVSGGDVSMWYSSSVRPFVLSADGSTVVYQADAEVDDRHELFSVPSDGSAPPVKLNGTLTADKDVEDYVLSPDGTRVVYAADQTAFPQRRLYSVLVHGSAPVLLGPSFGSPFSFLDFGITPDSSHVLSEFENDLYSAPIDGSSGPAKLNGASTPVWQFAATADGSRVVFRATSGAVRRVFSNAIDGGSLLDLSAGLGTAGDIGGFQLSVDGTRVVCIGDNGVAGQFRLMSLPVDGSSSGVVLNGPLVAGGDVSHFGISPDRETVVYEADQEVNESDRLHRVPVDGSAPDVQLSTQDFDAHGFVIAPDGEHVLVGFGGLQSVPITGGSAVQISPIAGDFAFAAGGRHVVQFRFGIGRLVLTPITADNPVPLSPVLAGDLSEFAVDGDRVVYRAEQDQDDVSEVYSSWIDRRVRHAPPAESRSVTH